ncbi:epithelial membrane protein 1 isoform X1 [Sander vitreus]
MLMLAGIVVLHIATIILLLVAAIDNAWWINDTVSTDLWGRWEFTNSAWHYTNLKNYPEEYLQAVQATSVLACIFAILALFVFVAQLFTLPKGQRFTFTGILQLIACSRVYISRFDLLIRRVSTTRLKITAVEYNCTKTKQYILRPVYNDSSLNLHSRASHQ